MGIDAGSSCSDRWAFTEPGEVPVRRLGHFPAVRVERRLFPCGKARLSAVCWLSCQSQASQCLPTHPLSRWLDGGGGAEASRPHKSLCVLL